VIGPEIVIPAGWITQKDRVTGSSASGAENRPSIKGKKIFTAGTRQKKALVRAPICIYTILQIICQKPEKSACTLKLSEPSSIANSAHYRFFDFN